MPYRNSAVLILLASIILFPAGAAHAEWLLEANPIVIQPDHQTLQVAIEDGEDGMIVIWQDLRSGSSYDIYAQRFDGRGNALWTTGGVQVCTITGNQQNLAAAPDGAGGAVIAWEDLRGGMYSDIYAQRIDASGTRLWNAAGVAVCTAAEDQTYPVITDDGKGGAIIAWRDFRNGVDDNIFARRVDAAGNVMWTVWGEPICEAANIQLSIDIMHDGKGGAFIAWSDYRSGSDYDIYSQLIDSTGTIQSIADGFTLCDVADHQYDPRFVYLSEYRVAVCWRDRRSGDIAIYLQLLEGTYISLATDGVEVCAPPPGYSVYGAKMVFTSDYHLIFTWMDSRDGPYNVYAQRMKLNGDQVWASEGVTVCGESGYQYYPDMVSDGEGGAIIAWYDSRNMINQRIYAQRIDAGGALLWQNGGIMLCDASEIQKNVTLVPDGQGNALASWQDWRNDLEEDLYAQRIDRSGYAGIPAPTIHSVADVPADQGGVVNLSWYCSYLDPWPYQEITRYTVWRSLSQEAAAAMAGSGAEVLDAASAWNILAESNSRGRDIQLTEDWHAAPEKPVIRIEKLGASTYFWELVATQDAQYYEQYSKLLETPFDSMAGFNDYTYYQVAAHTADPLTVWTSEPDSGYSVDNLAPGAPLGLAGEQSYLPEGLQISWDPNTEADLSHYNIYRGTFPTFPPVRTYMIASTPDTACFDGSWHWDSGYYYKVSAVDIHDNESGFALLEPGGVTGDDPEQVPSASYLAQNYPNPFNPQTTIAFGLKAPAHVSLRIFNAAGQLVRVLVNEQREARHYEEVWDGRGEGGIAAASGVYFYSLDAGEFRETRKMVLLR